MTNRDCRSSRVNVFSYPSARRYSPPEKPRRSVSFVPGSYSQALRPAADAPINRSDAPSTNPLESRNAGVE